MLIRTVMARSVSTCGRVRPTAPLVSLRSSAQEAPSHCASPVHPSHPLVCPGLLTCTPPTHASLTPLHTGSQIDYQAFVSIMTTKPADAKPADAKPAK